jgi:hypothetical protein
VFGSFRETPGRGVLVTHDKTFLYCAYQLQLIDLKSGFIDYTSNVASFKQIPIYYHDLSVSDRQRIIKDWEEEKSRTYKVGQGYETPEMVLAKASMYTSDDFKNISSEILNKINEQLRPVVKAGIKQNLIGTGLVSGRNSGLFNFLAPDERVKRPVN